MIPRYQKIVVLVLLVVSIAMAAVLVRLRERAHDRRLKGEDLAPTSAPAVAPAVQASLVVANDQDGTMITESQSLPLPADGEARARALIEKLLELYAEPGSTHPVPGVPRAVLQVFLMPQPQTQGKSDAPSGGQLAVVDLAGDFADGHPSGIQTEALTIESICSTLRANLPQVAEVRFLVDGQPRATLAGHADLTRTYLTLETTSPDTAAGATP